MDALIPLNSKKCRGTALNAFERFLADENVSMPTIKLAIAGDYSGRTLCAVLEKFAMHLLRQPSRKGELLAKNSLLSYFGQTKNEMLAWFPDQEVRVQKALLKMQKRIDKFCTTRGSQTERQAPLCTKRDLKCLVKALFCAATSEKSYADAALLCVMWFTFGRSSDMASLRKCNIAVYPGGCLFLRFARIKTGSVHGLTLFVDKFEFYTCPVQCLAVAMIMQTAPSTSLLDNIPTHEAQ